PTPDSGTNNKWTFATLNPGQQVTITITGTVSPGASGKLTNSVTVTSGTPDPDTKNNSATATTTVDIVADLAVTKTVSPSVARPGDTITYTVTVKNSGPSDAPNVVLTETYPAGFTFGSATPNPDSGTYNKWTLGKLAVGQSKTITITGTVAAGTSGTLTNTAVVELKSPQVGAQAGTDPNINNNTAKAQNTIAFFTGFEGWVSNGLWYIRRDNGCFGTCTLFDPPYVQFARLVDDCNARTYNLGTSKAYGILTSPVIRPPAGSSGWVLISVDFYRQVEKERPNGDYDRTYVQISVNGKTWTTIWSRSSRNGSEECGTIQYVIQSMPQYFQIRFVFDSVDYRYNNYKGWALDNFWAAVVPTGSTSVKEVELAGGDPAAELTVVNIPNPVTDVHTTTFKVLGPMAEQVERMRVRVFDLSGRLVWEGETVGNALDWHTTDFLGRYLANGIYLYQVQVYIAGIWVNTPIQKLAIYR
ncbi:MAG: DUF11 domain-containing protein, partial [Thermofilaceae archaeon]